MHPEPPTPSAVLPSPARIIVVDDDPEVGRSYARALGRAGHLVKAFTGGEEVLQELRAVAGNVDLVLSDLHMPQMDGLELVKRVRASWPEIPAILLSGDDSVRWAVEAMRCGAYDYVTKPVGSYDAVFSTVGRALGLRRSLLLPGGPGLVEGAEGAEHFEGMVAATPSMRAVFRLLDSVAANDVTLLLLGESGTGKELLARAAHARSGRSGRAFVPINCAALTETLLDSELFGHVRGAFTGAASNRDGVFQEASGGTLFLDEIGDISPAIQVRLLRAIQEGEIKPVGSSEIRRVDVRVIAATNRDLGAAVKAGRFREDLYYRLAVVEILVPPLRDRPQDIVLLARHFLALYGARFGKALHRFDDAALATLQGHRWPGNVRELENVVQRAAALGRGDIVHAADLPPAIQRATARTEETRLLVLPFIDAKDEVMSSFERRYITDALIRSGGNLAEAARCCSLDKSNFRRIARRHAISLAAFRAD
jgi:DNA-binding NtrC family response regulator